ncbi:hypothetical protein AB4Z54_00035 [Streptomyces sp. MCAF7]
MSDTRPPLPMRPPPHERDGRQDSPSSGHPHPRAVPGFSGHQ